MVAQVSMKYTSGLGFVKKYRDLVLEESLRGVNEADLIVREQMIEASPFGGTGLLKQSWTTRPALVLGANKVGGRVVAKGSVSANVVEGGAKPHFPPVGSGGSSSALGTWIRRKLGQTDPKQIRKTAFAISSTFRKHGIPTRNGGRVSPKRIFSIAFKKNTGRIVGVMKSMMSRIGQRF